MLPQITFSSLLPYFYLVAAVFLVFEASICGMKMYLDSKIEEETKRLQSTLENHRELQVTHEEKVTGKLDNLSMILLPSQERAL